MNKMQVSDTIMMIRPSDFGFNKFTAFDNVYQKNDKHGLSKRDIAKKAIIEFDNFVSILKSANINVIQFEDNISLSTPDSIFPNNWISTHVEGVVFLYPMFSPNRRIERRKDIVEYLKNNFVVKNIFNKAEYYESQHVFLEGTGSMVLDRRNKIAYGAISKRTNENLFYKWCKMMNFKPVSFIAEDSGKSIYHTNVLMSICDHVVFICLDSIVDPGKKEELLSLFIETKKEIINISKNQMNSFLGNVLEVKNTQNESFLIMSSSAFFMLNSHQKEIINKKSKILHSSLNTIEYFGGGSARCMMTEIFLSPNYGPKLKFPIFS